MGLQIAIAILGRFRQARLDTYVDCLEQFLNTTLPANTTFPVSELFVLVYHYCVYRYCVCCSCLLLCLLFLFIIIVYCCVIIVVVLVVFVVIVPHI